MRIIHFRILLAALFPCAMLVIYPFSSSAQINDKAKDSNSQFVILSSPSSASFSSYKPSFSEDSVTIPLRRIGRIYLIEAKVDGEKGYLAFDTGASGVVMNESYFRHRQTVDRQSSNGVNGSMGDVKSIFVDNLEFSGIQYTNLLADLVNLGHIENRLGVKILGLLGFTLLKSYEVIFDPYQNQLHLYLVDKKGDRIKSSSEKFFADFTSSFEFRNNILLLNATIANKNLKFCMDTGAETNVIDRRAPKSVMNVITITRRSSVLGTGSNASEVLFGTMNSFQFGSKSFDNMETIITNLDPLSEAYGAKIDGMLGYSFLSKVVICINFVKKELGVSYLKVNNQ